MKRILSVLISAALLATLAACGGTAIPQGGGSQVYTATAQGFGGEFAVEVEMAGDVITDIRVGDHAETENLGSVAVEQLPELIVERQSIAVDGIAGATVTSDALLAAVASCIEQSGADIDRYLSAGEEPGEREELELEADVVVVGAGGAGMTAAIEAATAGKRVILVEKAAMAGGNTTRSTGGMNAAATPDQDGNEFTEGAGVEKTIADAKAAYGEELAELIAAVERQYADYTESPQGYFDTVELFMLDTLVGGKNVNDPRLVEILARYSGDSIAWLGEISAELSSVGSFGGASVKRIHRPVDGEGKTIAVGSYLVPILQRSCEALGVEIIYNTAATEILMEEGRAVGVRANSATAAYTIGAGAVVLATGGFGANEEMYTSYQPDLAGYVTTNAPGMTGDGIVMAQAVGADTVDMEQIQIHPTVEQQTSALITEGLRGDGAILVNREGLRFVDEVGTRDVVSAAIVSQTDSFAFLIVDQAMVDASSVIAGYIASGYTVEGESYEALAGAMGVDGSALAATMEEWNVSVAAGSDAAFGRTSFADALDTAPYYAIRVAPGVHHTMGGLAINENTQVLDTRGDAIPGLFAAGEVTGGIHGANRLGGNAVADIVVFGRIAGQQAAAFAG